MALDKGTLRRARMVAALPLFAVVVGVACLPGMRAPDVPPSNTLGLRELGASNEDAGPLRVVFASPKGTLKGPSEITVLFNEPMRALETAGAQTPFPAVVDPPIEGTWQWAGTRAGSFIPARKGGGGAFRLPKATKFTVTVPHGTKSLDGDTLAEDYSFTFETERPRVVSTSPGSTASGLDTSATFTLYFDQPIDEAEVKRTVTLSAAGKVVGYTVRRDDATNDKKYELVPAAPLPKASPIAIEVKEGLKGKEGPLASTASQSFSYETYGPLQVTEARCGSQRADKKCDAPDGVVVTFSNAVKLKDLKRAVSFEPPVKVRWPTWMEDEETLDSVDLGGNFLPGKTYTLHLKTPLTDEFGQALAASFEKKLDFGDLDPIARIGLTEGVLEASAKRDVTVAHINATDLEVAAVRLDEDTILALADEDVGFDELAKKPSIAFSKIPRGRTNVLERHKVELDDVLGKKGRGAFVVLAQYTSNGHRQTERRVAQVTDLAVTAKVSKHGSVVLVTRLADATPVADAEVRIRRRGQAAVTQKTDAQGFATFGSDFVPTWGDEDAVIFVKKGDDTAYKAVSEHIWNSFEPGDDGSVGFLFNDRGIYRPGEVAHIKGILRDPLPNGLKTPAAGTPVSLVVEGPDGEKVAALGTTLTSFGTFTASVSLPRTGRLGSYWVKAVRGTETIAEDTLQVAEFRAAEFKVAVESDKVSYTRGDNAKWVGRGDYLYGAPMFGAKAELDVSRTQVHYAPTDTDGFDVDDEAYQWDLPSTGLRRSSVTSSDVSLDASGSASIGATLDMPGMVGAERVRAVIDVSDVSRQTISGSTTALVHPGEHYVGIGLDRRFVDAKTKLSPSFIAVKPNGDRVVGAPIKVAFIKRSWAVAKQGTGGAAASTVSTHVDKVIASCALVSAKKPVSCDMTPPDAGRYIVRVTSEDARKNPVAASLNVYVTGESADALSAFEESDEPTIELVTNKENYAVGDTAKVLVKSPWKGAEALVTVERSGIFEKRRVKLTGAAPTIDVPITEDMRPNAYVSVMVLRGRTKKMPASQDKPDVGAPDFVLGETNLVIDPTSKRLKVAVAPGRTDAKPGEEAEISLKVVDAKGKGTKSELTVYAVDEGVLSLVNYRLPDPIETFGAARPLRVATLESRSDLARLFDPLTGLGQDKGMYGGGGGGPSGSSGPRADFRPNAYFNANVLTNDDGAASVKFKLPDGLTTYRVMAVAVATDDRFGAGESRITTSRPLMARPALPRFLRAGDTFQASVVVSSKATVTQEVEVTAQLAGVVLTGEKKKKVTVEPGKSVEVRFSAEAPRVGPATFEFHVGSGSESDSVRIERRVQIPLSLESVALYGQTNAASAEKLGDLSGIRDDTGELTVTTASTALVGLDGGSSQLLDYPYGCTEQLTSKLVPLVALKDLATDFKLTMPANLNDVVDKTVAKVLTHQRYEGGFGFWPDSPEANAWATTYALWGLDQAKKKGYSVPSGALERAAQYLFSQLERGDESFKKNVGPFALYVLAEMGKPDPGRASTMFADRASMPLYSKALLTSAMALQKGDPASITELVKEIETSIRIDGNLARTAENLGDDYAVYLDSNTRTSAIVLRALLHARPDHPLASKLAMGLLADRDGSQWRSTQEGAWALLALGDYRRAQEKVEPNFAAHVFFGEAVVADQEFRGRSLAPQVATFPTARLLAQSGAVLAFQVEGQGNLFYEARLRYARKTLPTDTLDRGFYVERRYRTVTADTLDEALATVPDATLASFGAGDLVLADIVVVTPKPRNFVAIDDPLPAGFEAVDMRLATTSDRLRQLDAPRGIDEDDAAMERAEWATAYTREVRDDRVLFFVDHMPAGVFRYRYLARATSLGAFVSPPTRAEAMYAPETFGRTGAATVVVEAK